MGRPPEMCACNLLRTKYFHGASSGSQHPYLLKSRYGKVSLLRSIQDEPLRAQMQLQLNRGERRHQLARRLFFAHQGAFQTGDYEEMMNKATCLSLLSNAVVVWNTVQMSHTLAQLRANGLTIAEADLARVSPLAFAHVI